MSNKNKKSCGKKIYETKYFKWGQTAFIVILLSSVTAYLLFHFSDFKGGLSRIVHVFLPIIDGLVIAYILNPLVRFFERDCIEKTYIKHGMSVGTKEKKRFRGIAITVTFVIAALLLYSFFGTVLPQLISSVETLINNFPTYYDNVINYINSIPDRYEIFANEDVLYYFDRYSAELEDFLTESILPNVKDMIKSLSSGVMSAVGALLDLIIGIIVAIYLLSGKEKYIGLVKKIIYSIFNREKANDIMTDLRFIDKTFGGFLIGKIIDSIIIGIICFIGLSLLKVPFAVLVSVIVGVTNIIPFFGPYLGAIPSAFIILLVDPKKCIVFLIFIVILQQVDGNIIGPTILGNSIGVSSLWIVVAITVFGGFFGIVGMLLGVPCFACAYAFIRRRVNNRLKRKGMSIATYDYAKTSYVDEDNRLVFIGENTALQESLNSRYVELNPAARNKTTSDKKSIPKRIKEICISIADAFRKLWDKIRGVFGKKG